MTSEQINETIAETCGWVSHKNADGDLSEPHLTRSWTEWIRPDGEAFTTPPDYCSDLNAMNEAEARLSADQAIKFRLRLSENSGRRNSEFPTVEAAMCHATARQRAEAFLKTLGKWK